MTPRYPVAKVIDLEGITPAELLDKFGAAKIREAARLIPKRRVELVEALVCQICGSQVDVKVLGLFAVMGVDPRDFALSLLCSVPRLTEQSEAVLNALNRMWAANYELDGMCGHEVTIDAAAEVQRDLEGQ